jgi:hypothetical protein
MGQQETAMNAKNRIYPYVVLVNVATITELERLREMARVDASRCGPSAHEVKMRNEAVYFCFEDSTAAGVFQQHCDIYCIPNRRIG